MGAKQVRIHMLAAAVLALVAATTMQAQDVRIAPAKVKAGANAGRIVARTYNLNEYNRYLDGQWQGIRVASDGRVYFGSSAHAHAYAGSFFRYDPRAAELDVLAKDMSALCGEEAGEQVPQGKTHSEIVEHDGWIYFATHLATYYKEARNNYSGSHVIGYELATGRFRDLGIVRPNFTTYSGLAVDPRRNVLYAMQVPFSDAGVRDDGLHLYEIDIPTAAKKDLGMVKAGGGACFFFLVDTRGNCWFSLAYDGGSISRYRPTTGEIDHFENALPLLRSLDDPNVPAEQIHERKGQQSSRFWGWMAPLPGPDGGPSDRCLFTMSSNTALVWGSVIWQFDAGVAQALQPAELDRAFTPVRHVGATGAKHASKVLCGDRVFYLQREGGVNGGPPKGQQDFHLMSASIDPEADPGIVDHGLLVDQDGRHAWRICSLAADPAGKRLFMTGDWYLLPGDKGALTMEGLNEAPKDGNFVYTERDRGQLFAVVEVP